MVGRVLLLGEGRSLDLRDLVLDIVLMIVVE